MIKSIILAGTFVFSLNLLADFSGTWQGFGKIILNQTTKSCPEFQVHFEQTEKYLKTTGSVLKCKGINILGKENILSIVDGKLMMDNIEIGNIADSKIETKFKDPVNGFNYSYKLEIIDQRMIDYSETVTTASGVLFYQVQAYLKLNLNLF